MEKISTRDGYGKALVELEDENVVVLAADLADSCRVNPFKEKHPDRFIQVGISEQDMFSMANGLALEGKIPFANTFAVFCCRCYDQIRVACYNKANIKIIGHHSGLTVGQDGATHQALEDISLFRSMPNMNVIVPCDAEEAKKATQEIAKSKEAYYLRLSREPVSAITDSSSEFKIGKANILKEGRDVLIVACGIMVEESLKAAQMLEQRGISAAVMNMHTIKPIDKEALIKYAEKTKAVVTAEEHSVYGGLGSAVCEVLSLSKIPIKILGIKDTFGESGKSAELLEKYGLTSEDIIEYCTDIMKFKEKQITSNQKCDDGIHCGENEERKQESIQAQKTRDFKDPRNRIMKMSDHQKKQVDDVLYKMFGGRRNPKP